MWTSQGEQIPGVGQGGYYANLIATSQKSRLLVDLVCHVLAANYLQRLGCTFKFKDVHWVEKYGVLMWLQIIFHHPFTCRGAIQRFKLNTCFGEIMV